MDRNIFNIIDELTLKDALYKAKQYCLKEVKDRFWDIRFYATEQRSSHLPSFKETEFAKTADDPSAGAQCHEHLALGEWMERWEAGHTPLHLACLSLLEKVVSHALSNHKTWIKHSPRNLTLPEDRRLVNKCNTNPLGCYGCFDDFCQKKMEIGFPSLALLGGVSFLNIVELHTLPIHSLFSACKIVEASDESKLLHILDALLLEDRRLINALFKVIHSEDDRCLAVETPLSLAIRFRSERVAREVWTRGGKIHPQTILSEEQTRTLNRVRGMTSKRKREVSIQEAAEVGTKQD